MLASSLRLQRMPHIASLVVLGFVAMTVTGLSSGVWANPQATATVQANIETQPSVGVDEYPTGELGKIVRLGESLVTETGKHPLTKSLVGNALHCTSCHLDAGTHERAASFIGVAAAYPAWSPRDNRVVTLEDRISQCFIRSQNGKLPTIGGDVTIAIAAYITWLSQDTKIMMNPSKPLGPNHIRGLQLTEVTADLVRGEKLYLSRCASCHEEDGSGNHEGPPVWGDQSFNDGAGLSQSMQMASWLKVSMPLDETDLSDQEAFDIATYITSKPRPKFIAE